MSIDFNDPASIRAWVAIHPQRHRAVLRGFWRLWPQFRPAMQEAMR
jgi:hypothetical protein